MPNALDITIDYDNGMVQSILIDGWPPDVPFPRIELVDRKSASFDAPTSGAEHADLSTPSGMEIHLPKALAHIRALGIEYICIEYAGRNGEGSLRLDAFQPSKQADRPAHFLSQQVAQEVKDFFFSVLFDRHPDCFETWGSTGVFRWFIAPERVVHRHDPRHLDAQTIVYHGL